MPNQAIWEAIQLSLSMPQHDFQIFGIKADEQQEFYEWVLHLETTIPHRKQAHIFDKFLQSQGKQIAPAYLCTSFHQHHPIKKSMAQ